MGMTVLWPDYAGAEMDMLYRTAFLVVANGLNATRAECHFMVDTIIEVDGEMIPIEMDYVLESVQEENQVYTFVLPESTTNAEHNNLMNERVDYGMVVTFYDQRSNIIDTIDYDNES